MRRDRDLEKSWDLHGVTGVSQKGPTGAGSEVEKGRNSQQGRYLSPVQEALYGMNCDTLPATGNLHKENEEFHLWGISDVSCDFHAFKN